MSRLTIKVKGIDKALRDLEQLDKKQIPKAINLGLTKSADFVLRTLNVNTPFDTGRLRSSNRVLVGETFAKIGPDLNIASYAPFVERGHHTRSGSFVPGQRYIQKTAIETRSGVNRIFTSAFKLSL